MATKFNFSNINSYENYKKLVGESEVFIGGGTYG